MRCSAGSARTREAHENGPLYRLLDPVRLRQNAPGISRAAAAPERGADGAGPTVRRPQPVASAAAAGPPGRTAPAPRNVRLARPATRSVPASGAVVARTAPVLQGLARPPRPTTRVRTRR